MDTDFRFWCLSWESFDVRRPLAMRRVLWGLWRTGEIREVVLAVTRVRFPLAPIGGER